MSFHEKNLQAFRQLLEEQSSLLSEQDKRDLYEIVNCPEEVEQQSIATTVWYANRPQLLEKQLRILDALITSEKGQRGPGLTSSGPSDEAAREFKNFIENWTRAGSPDSASPSSESQRSNNNDKSDSERLNQQKNDPAN